MKKMETKQRGTAEKKLGLHRETLRRLDPAELRRMDAGRMAVAVSSPCGPPITTNP
jgi:hypothetical protein